MTQLVRRQGPWGEINDLHKRVRRLEASPGGGGGSCPECVLDPYTVNPDDIVVPEAYWGCVDVGAGCNQFDQTCGAGTVALVANVSAGFCSGYDLSLPLRLQLSFTATLGTGGDLSNTANVILLAGPIGFEAQVFSKTWPVAGLPGAAGGSYASGWVDIPDVCAGSCDEITISATFQSHNGGGGCAGPGFLCSRWVRVEEDGEYRGALDDLPQGEAFGDTIYFNPETGAMYEGPRSLPSRAMTTFMG